MIRPATIHDVPRIQAIINSHAELGRMLFKSYAQLYEDLRDFAVCERDGRVVGCCALTILWADLAEVRSLAVADAHLGRGIGRQLVEWAVEEARKFQIRRLMALTYEQGFFEKLGFAVVSKESLPLKVWSDCVRCPKRENCDEIAVVRVLPDVPLIPHPTAPPNPQGREHPRPATPRRLTRPSLRIDAILPFHRQMSSLEPLREHHIHPHVGELRIRQLNRRVQHDPSHTIWLKGVKNETERGRFELP